MSVNENLNAGSNVIITMFDEEVGGYMGEFYAEIDFDTAADIEEQAEAEYKGSRDEQVQFAKEDAEGDFYNAQYYAFD